MMKKMITLFSAIAMGATLYAGITDKPTEINYDAYADRAGHVNGIQNSVVFYQDSYVVYKYEGVGENNNGLRDLTSWGDITFSMYTIDDNKNIIDTFSIASAMEQGTFAQLMQAGVDKVGFSISNGSKTIYSTPGINGNNGTRLATYMDEGWLYMGFFVDGYTQNAVDKADVIYAVTVVHGGGANGQPLPGVLASMLIGAGVLRLRRRK